MCELPAGWQDLANIRQVPDNQECWLNPIDESLLVVEILDRQSQVDDARAAKYYYDDLAETNGVVTGDRTFSPLSPTIVQNVHLPSDAILCFGTGFQRVAMGREFDIAGNRRQQEVRWIQVELGVVRLPSVLTDVLVTLSTPTSEVNQQKTNATDVRVSVFRSVVATLEVRDWGLFGSA